jgi:hypothetical protein
LEKIVTLSVEELNNMIDEKVQAALENAKPVRDERMKALETHFKEEIYNKKLDLNWNTSWTAIRTSVALKMGYRSASKVPQHRYDELLENIKHESEIILEVFSKENKNGITNI